MLENFLHQIYFNIHLYAEILFPLENTFLGKLFFILAIFFWLYVAIGVIFTMLGLMIGERYIKKHKKIIKKMQHRAQLCLHKNSDFKAKYGK